MRDKEENLSYLSWSYVHVLLSLGSHPSAQYLLAIIQPVGY